MLDLVLNIKYSNYFIFVRDIKSNGDFIVWFYIRSFILLYLVRFYRRIYRGDLLFFSFYLELEGFFLLDYVVICDFYVSGL